LCSISFHADKEELAILMRQDGQHRLQDSGETVLMLLKIAIFGSLVVAT